MIIMTTGYPREEPPLHIVYCIEAGERLGAGCAIPCVSHAIKQALSGLRVADTFSVVVFADEAEAFSKRLLPAIPGNIESALQFMECGISGSGADFSQALDMALTIGRVNHVYLITAGGPVGGMEDFAALRAHIRGKNVREARISCIGVEAEGAFPAADLMCGIASDNGGTFFFLKPHVGESCD